MTGRLIIERLEFQGHLGVTPEERGALQPIAVDIELDQPSTAQAAATDDLTQAVDYAQVAQRIVEVGGSGQFHLVETLAERLTEMIFAEFPVSRVRLWVRKLAPPLQAVHGSVGIQVDRTRPAESGPLPAAFLIEQLPRLPKGLVLDVAAGAGRHALYLAGRGFTVEAVDRDEQALAALAGAARERNLTTLTVRTLDLEAEPPPALPKAQFDVIMVFFYLHRPLFPGLLQALKPGGVLLYETFLLDNHLRRHHPRSKEFCLAPNELLRLSDGLRVLHYDEGEHEDARGGGPAWTARLLAVRPGDTAP